MGIYDIQNATSVFVAFGKLIFLFNTHFQFLKFSYINKAFVRIGILDYPIGRKTNFLYIPPKQQDVTDISKSFILLMDQLNQNYQTQPYRTHQNLTESMQQFRDHL